MYNDCCGYPPDDEYSIQQGSPGASVNLDMYYQYQFVQNENLLNGKVEEKDGELWTRYILGHTPVCPGTLAASISFGKSYRMVYTFVVQSNGEFIIHDVANGDRVARPVEGKLNCETGEILLRWQGYPPSDHRVVANYEYEYGVERGSGQTPPLLNERQTEVLKQLYLYIKACGSSHGPNTHMPLLKDVHDALFVLGKQHGFVE